MVETPGIIQRMQIRDTSELDVTSIPDEDQISINCGAEDVEYETALSSMEMDEPTQLLPTPSMVPNLVEDAREGHLTWNGFLGTFLLCLFSIVIILAVGMLLKVDAGFCQSNYDMFFKFRIYYHAPPPV